MQQLFMEQWGRALQQLPSMASAWTGWPASGTPMVQLDAQQL